MYVHGLPMWDVRYTCDALTALAERIDVGRWVTALRSGEYVQGTGTLHTILKTWDEYCCLGVLCELEGVHSNILHAQPGDSVTYEGYDACLPPSLTGDSGVTQDVDLPFTRIEREGVRKASLVNLNDVDRISFAEIADIVEYFVRPTDPLWLAEHGFEE